MPRFQGTQETTRVDDLFAFIRERHQIYRRREVGKSKPWTTDPILAEWRFCNVYRELDTVTKWIAANWREPHKDDPDLWFAMAIARFVNWPDTLAELGYPVPWNPRRFRRSSGRSTGTRRKGLHRRLLDSRKPRVPRQQGRIPRTESIHALVDG